MAKKKSKIEKYYAIKVGRDTKDTIVRTWDECKAIVTGYPSIYKSFRTEEEALEYLGSIKDTTKKLENINIAIKSRKEKKKNTTAITNVFKGVRIDNDLINDFTKKCEEFNTSTDKMLIELIKEWTY